MRRRLGVDAEVEIALRPIVQYEKTGSCEGWLEIAKAEKNRRLEEVNVRIKRLNATIERLDIKRVEVLEKLDEQKDREENKHEEVMAVRRNMLEGVEVPEVRPEVLMAKMRRNEAEGMRAQDEMAQLVAERVQLSNEIQMSVYTPEETRNARAQEARLRAARDGPADLLEKNRLWKAFLRRFFKVCFQARDEAHALQLAENTLRTGMNDVRRPSKTLERAWGTIIRKYFMLCKWVCTVWEKKSSKRESSWAVQLWGKFLQGLAREELPAWRNKLGLGGLL